MGLRQRVAAAFHAFRQTEKIAGSEAAWNRIFSAGLDQLFPLLGDSLRQPYAQHPTIYAAISAIAGSLSAIPLEFFPESDSKHETPIEDSIVAQLLAEPNDSTDGPMLWFGTWVFRELYGEAFWLLDEITRRSGTDQPFPRKLYLWNPLNVRGPITAREFNGWELQDGQRVFRVPYERVLQFKYFNPYDENRGLSPWNPARVIANADYKGAVWNEAFMSNSAIPAGIIVPEQGSPVHKDAMDRLREQWEERHQGAVNRGRLGFLNFAAKFLDVGLSHKDMDFDALMDAATEKILMVWKVPPTVAGMSKNANYQEATRQAKQFYHNHEPSLHYAEAVIYRRLCRAFGVKEKPFFKTETIKALVEDQEAVARTARELWSMGVPFDMINERLELGIDAEAHPSMQEPWLTFSMAPADKLLDDASQPPRNARPGDTQNQPAAPPTGEPNAQPNTDSRPALVKNREFTRAMSWRVLMSKVRNEEGAYHSRVHQHFSMLEREVLFHLRIRPKKADDALMVSVEEVMFDRDKAAKDITGKTKPIYQSAIQEGYRTVLAELRLNIDFELLTPQVEQFMEDKKIELPDLVDGPAEEALRQTLQEGIAAGDNLQEMTKRVEQVFDVQRGRAARIARTEVAESFNGGRYETMKAADVQKLEWLTARDNRVRDSHVELDGEIVELGSPFSNGLKYPLDPAGPPEEIVNCRCVSLPAA